MMISKSPSHNRPRHLQLSRDTGGNDGTLTRKRIFPGQSETQAPDSNPNGDFAKPYHKTNKDIKECATVNHETAAHLTPPKVEDPQEHRCDTETPSVYWNKSFKSRSSDRLLALMSVERKEADQSFHLKAGDLLELDASEKIHLKSGCVPVLLEIYDSVDVCEDSQSVTTVDAPRLPA